MYCNMFHLDKINSSNINISQQYSYVNLLIFAFRLLLITNKKGIFE